jgi:hypothetical protein
LRLSAVLVDWSFLNNLSLSVPPLTLALSTAFWAGLGLWLAWALWTAKPWALRAAMLSGVAFAAFVWLERLFLQAAGPQQSSRPFDLILTALLLGAFLALLGLPEVKAYLGAKHD